MDDSVYPVPREEQERVDAEKKLASLEQLRRNEDMRKVLETYEGRALLWDLMAEFGLHADPFRGEATHEMARACGKLSCAQAIQLKVLTCMPDAYSLMQSEYAQRKRNQESK